MISSTEELIKNFIISAQRIGISVEVTHELVTAPHIPPQLPVGKCAVYVFSLSDTFADRHRFEAVPGKVLKVGRVGPGSNARFQYQHYNPSSAGSTLAGSILHNPILWPYLRIGNMDETNVADWMKQSLDRDHFYMSASDKENLVYLEVFLKGHLGPVFEG